MTCSVAAATVLYEPDVTLLDALLAATGRGEDRPLYLFVNGPLAVEAEARIARLANAHVIRSATNVGLGSGLNAVMEAAAADGVTHVFLLDQDSSPSPDLSKRLAERLVTLNSTARPVAAVGPLLTVPGGTTYLPMRSDWLDPRQNSVNAEVYFLPTSGTVLSVDAWRRIGAFRGDYFIGGIDVEWGFRARHHGFRLFVARDLSMPHRWGHEADEGARKPQILRQGRLRNYFYFRNAAHLLRQAYVPWPWRLRYAARLAAQGLLLIAHSPAEGAGALWHGIVAGWSGQLGPAPASFISRG